MNMNIKKITTVIVFFFALFFTALSVQAATLSLSPSSSNYSVGQIFSVDILLDTKGTAIDGVDIVYLNYNPNYLEVVDDNASQSGIQITPGALMPMTLANTVNATNGKITFSQITAGGNTFTSSGAQVLATVHFKVLQAINTQVYFDFVVNGTADTNVASVGKDVLTAITNGNYGPGAQTPAPTPPTSPAPAPVAPIVPPPVTTAPITSCVTTLSTLESIQLKINNLISKISLLSNTPSTEDLTAIQTEIACVLNELKSLQTPTLPAGFTFTKSLYLGLVDNDVKNLQQLLKSDPSIYPEGVVNGKFGPATLRAVKRFQLKYGITTENGPGYGYVGPKTRAKLNELIGGN